MWQELVTASDHYQLFYFNDTKSGSEASGFTLWRKVVGDDLAHLLKIAIAPSLQGQGVGRSLLMGSIELLQGSPSRYYLEVEESNLAAISLYHRCGFSQIDRPKGFYTGGCGELAMGINL
jgi:[ribosomal protein S18]-alanine N-acetyltransferase